MVCRDEVAVALRKPPEEIEELAEGFLEDFAPDRLDKPGHLNVLRALDCHMYTKYSFRSDIDSSLPHNVEGITNFAEMKISLRPEVYSGAAAGHGRPRFTIAHEIGHVVTIGGQMDKRIRFTDHVPQVVMPRINVKDCQNPEWQANFFAGAVLMPRKVFWEGYENGEGREDLAASIFGVSKGAFRTRLNVLLRFGWGPRNR